jgi:hypothetical protein
MPGIAISMSATSGLKDSTIARGLGSVRRALDHMAFQFRHRAQRRCGVCAVMDKQDACWHDRARRSGGPIHHACAENRQPQRYLGSLTFTGARTSDGQRAPCASFADGDARPASKKEMARLSGPIGSNHLTVDGAGGGMFEFGVPSGPCFSSKRTGQAVHAFPMRATVPGHESRAVSSIDKRAEEHLFFRGGSDLFHRLSGCPV